jgi:hypothetical protein
MEHTGPVSIYAISYKQVDDVHCNSANILVPVMNDVIICIVLVIMLMANWCGKLLDIKGAFLHGDFEDGKKVYMEVPERFDMYYCCYRQFMGLREQPGTQSSYGQATGTSVAFSNLFTRNYFQIYF